MIIRYANINDLNSIVDIYNQAIDYGKSTADQTKIVSNQKVEWLNNHIGSKFPVYVVEDFNEIVGWGSLSPYRDRDALKHIAEISYYIHFNHHSKSYGSKLIDFIIDDARKLGFEVLVAILLSENVNSVKILKKFEFEMWGRLPEVAKLKNAVCDHLIYGKRIIKKI